MRLAIRVFTGGVERHEDLVVIENGDSIEALIAQVAVEHVRMLLEEPGMIEIEFLDEADESQRFLRLGTDPSGMVSPVDLISLN